MFLLGREDASDHAWLAGGETTAAEEHVSALAANEDFDVTVRQRSRNEREPTAGLTAPATLVGRRSNASLAQLPPFSSKQRSIRQLLPSIPQQNMTATPGSRAILKCRVENLGTKTVCTLVLSMLQRAYLLGVAVTYTVGLYPTSAT